MIRALAFTITVLAASAMAVAPPPVLFAPGARILFQGDSITDMGRGRTEDPNHILGHSYVFLIAAKQGAAFPEQNWIFINRGVGGNTLPDMAARWSTDTLALKPDVLSILIGVNDVGHALRQNQPVAIELYERTYDQLLTETVAALPNVKLVLCEPFFAAGKSTNEHLAEWQAAMQAMRTVVAKLGVKYHAPVVHFQRLFDAACQRAAVGHWIWDGVHPTYSGHQLMADEWERTFRAFYGPSAGTL
jgi:lysophospholipase L1-like esterase